MCSSSSVAMNSKNDLGISADMLPGTGGGGAGGGGLGCQEDNVPEVNDLNCGAPTSSFVMIITGTHYGQY